MSFIKMSFDGFAAVEDDSTLESVTPDDYYGGDSDHGDGGHGDGDCHRDGVQNKQRGHVIFMLFIFH